MGTKPQENKADAVILWQHWRRILSRRLAIIRSKINGSLARTNVHTPAARPVRRISPLPSSSCISQESCPPRRDKSSQDKTAKDSVFERLRAAVGI